MSEKISLLLVDDHEVVRKGMGYLLEDEEQIEIIGEAENGKNAIEQIEKLNPNVVLLDINMPIMNGLEAGEIIVKKFPKTRTLVFSMHSDPDYILKSINNGVDGYVLKNAEKEEIVKAIQMVHAGLKYFPTDVSAILVSTLQKQGTPPPKKEKYIIDLLSNKEQEILKLIAEGLSSKDIALRLRLSVRTVSNHRANMLKKTGLNNTVELIRITTNEGF